MRQKTPPTSHPARRTAVPPAHNSNNNHDNESGNHNESGTVAGHVHPRGEDANDIDSGNNGEVFNNENGNEVISIADSSPDDDSGNNGEDGANDFPNVSANVQPPILDNADEYPFNGLRPIAQRRVRAGQLIVVTEHPYHEENIGLFGIVTAVNPNHDVNNSNGDVYTVNLFYRDQTPTMFGRQGYIITYHRHNFFAVHDEGIRTVLDADGGLWLEYNN